MNGFYWIYIVICAVALGSSFATGREQKTRLFYLGCGVLIVLFVAQDTGVGVDLREYLRQYALIKTLSWKAFFTHKFEFGYVILNRLLGMVFEGDRVLVLCVGILIFLPFFRWIRRESGNPAMSLLLFVALGFYTHAFLMYRQLCAMAILTLAYRFVRERKGIPFLLTVLLAMSFHRTAAIFLPVYFLYSIPADRRLMAAAVIGSFVVGLLGKPILNFLNLFVYAPGTPLFEGGITMYVVLWVSALVVYWLLRERLEETRIKLPFIMLLLAAVLQSIAFTFSNWARVMLYLRVSMVLLIPELYAAVFQQAAGSKLLALLERRTPGLHRAVLSVYDTKWFQAAVQAVMFGVLFVWFQSDLDGMVYTLAPV